MVYQPVLESEKRHRKCVADSDSDEQKGDRSRAVADRRAAEYLRSEVHSIRLVDGAWSAHEPCDRHDGGGPSPI